MTWSIDATTQLQLVWFGHVCNAHVVLDSLACARSASGIPIRGDQSLPRMARTMEAILVRILKRGHPNFTQVFAVVHHNARKASIVSWALRHGNFCKHT